MVIKDYISIKDLPLYFENEKDVVLEYKGIKYKLKYKKDIQGYIYNGCDKDLIKDIITLTKAHFEEDFPVCIYPFKAYFVSIVYAYGLCSVFEDYRLLHQLEGLNFKDLYSFQPFVYNDIIYMSILKNLIIDPNKGTTPVTLKYFEDEYNVQDINYKILDVSTVLK